MVRITDINADAASAAAASLPANSPVCMVNLLRYKEYADYGNAAGESPCSGREVYLLRYVKAFNSIAASEGVRLLFLGNVSAGIVLPEGEQWDDVAIVEYPSYATFCRIIESAEYIAEAAPHRSAALADWRLIVTRQARL